MKILGAVIIKIIIVAITASAVFLIGQSLLPDIDPEYKNFFLAGSSIFAAVTACVGIYSMMVTTTDGSKIHFNLIRTKQTDVTIWVGLLRDSIPPKYDYVEFMCCKGLKTVRIKSNGQKYKSKIQLNGVMYMDVLIDHESITVQERGFREEDDYEIRPKTHMVSFIASCLVMFIMALAMMFGEYIRWQ